MRYYRIDIVDKNGTPRLPSSLSAPGIQLGLTSLLPNGQVNPAALQIEFDLPLAFAHQPTGNAYLKVWGLSLKDIGAAFDLQGSYVSIYAGMSAGLPLANPKQAGLIMHGQILQSFGNWLGLEQSIDLIFAPAGGFPGQPQNFCIHWPAGQPLATALKQTLSNGLPAAKRVLSISPRLVQNHDEAGVYGTLEALNSWLHPLSQSIITDKGYAGVMIGFDGQTVTATDMTVPTTPIQIDPRDLLGQPTWIDNGTIQMATVLRADINLGDTVFLPPTLVSVSAAANFRENYTAQKGLTFSGKFKVVDIHHYGNFRQNDAASWNSKFNMLLLPPGSASGA